jgi:hypothetical protein
MSDCILLVYRGCLSEKFNLDLFQTLNVKLDPNQRQTSETKTQKDESKKL